MRKYLLILLWGLFAFTANSQSMYIQTINSEFIDHSIENITTISFPNDHLQITNEDGSTSSINLAAVKKIVFEPSYGISENVAEKDNFSFFPNPSQDKVFVRTNNTDELVKVYNLQGVLILEQYLNSTESVIDVSEWSAGVYFIQINLSTQKLLVQ